MCTVSSVDPVVASSLLSARQPRVSNQRELVETTTRSGSNHALRFEPGIVVRTTVFWNVPRQWFEPQKSGPDQKFPVWTTLLWSGPDKVVQTGEKWYFQNYKKKQFLLVQTTFPGSNRENLAHP